VRRRAASAAAAAGTLTLALTLAATVIAPAYASTASASIVRTSIDHNRMTVLMNAVGLSAGERIDPSTARLTIGGQAVAVVARPVSDVTESVTRTVILAVDISGSMFGKPLAAAKQAIHAFVTAVPPDVKIGLVAFGADAKLVARPSTNHAALLTATDALATKGETALYDGVLLALSSTGKAGVRAVLVLSDGDDTVSRHKVTDVSNSLSTDVLVDVVPLATTADQARLLASWAKATGGRSIQAANSSQLAAAFAAAAADASNQVVFTAAVPASAAGSSVTVTASISVGDAVLSASDVTEISAPPAVVTIPPTPTATATPAPAIVPIPEALPTSRIAPTTLLYAGLGALFLALVVVAAFALGVGAGNGDAARVQRHMAVYSLTRRGPRREPQTTQFGDSSVARNAVELADRVARARGFDASLRRRLDAAGVPMRGGEWVLLHAGAVFVGGFLFLALTGGQVLPAIIGLVLGALAPGAYLTIKESRRKAAFAEQLPEMLQLVAGSLSAGYSLPQAFDTAAREGSAPMSTELSRALVQTRLGLPLEDALEAVGERMLSKDFSWVVMAIRIQRDVGGNLAEVLTTVAETLRERERLRRQVNVLSAEGKLSAYILFALPIIMALYMLVVRPAYISVLWTTPTGLALLIVGVGLQATGAFWLSKVTKVEV
jgi:tight adherence protein B